MANRQGQLTREISVEKSFFRSFYNVNEFRKGLQCFSPKTLGRYTPKRDVKIIIAISKTAVALAVFNIDAAAWRPQILYA